MPPKQEVIETTASNVAAELARRGIGPDDRVTITIEPDQELIPGRRQSRALVIIAGLTDDDIDRLIGEAPPYKAGDDRLLHVIARGCGNEYPIGARPQ